MQSRSDRRPDRWGTGTLPRRRGRKRFLIIHGHGHDRLIRVARHIVELGVCLGGGIRRAGCHGWYQRLDALDQARSVISAEPSRCRFQAWAVGVASRSDADVVVTGHTHVPNASEHGSRLYLNSGSCSRGRFTYLALETRSDVYAVHHAW